MSADGPNPGEAAGAAARAAGLGIDPQLLALLRCPVSGAPLELDAARGELVSRTAGLAYPIRDGVPVMLPEEARPL